MAGQVVLNNKESTYGGPYGYYTVTLTPSNRTANSVTVKCDVSAYLKYSDSYTQYGVTCGLYIGGKWHDFILVPYGTYWQGTTPISASTTITVSGLTATQTSITGIKFRAIDGASESEGPSLSSTSCSNLTIATSETGTGSTHINVGGAWKAATVYINVSGTWKEATPYMNVDGVWKKCF